MRCEAFEDRLQQLLDERQLPEEDAALADHAAACPTCREVLDAQAGLFDTVRDWSVANLEVDLVDRVVVRAAAAARPKRRSWWPASWRGGSGRWISVVAAAALIVVAWKTYEHYGASVARQPDPAEKSTEPKSPSGLPDERLALEALPQFGPIEIDRVAEQAAEDLGYSIAWGCHYLHRGRNAVAGVILNQFPRKAAEPAVRSSSLLGPTAALAIG